MLRFVAVSLLLPALKYVNVSTQMSQQFFLFSYIIAA
jgi:hypothetical protein